MPLSRLGSFGKTTVEASALASATYVNAGPYSLHLVYVEKDTCIARADVATVNDLLIIGGNYACLRLDAGGSLSYIIATGSSAGAVRITQLGDDW